MGIKGVGTKNQEGLLISYYGYYFVERLNTLSLTPSVGSISPSSRFSYNSSVKEVNQVNGRSTLRFRNLHEPVPNATGEAVEGAAGLPPTTVGLFPKSQCFFARRECRPAKCYPNLTSLGQHHPMDDPLDRWRPM